MNTVESEQYFFFFYLLIFIVVGVSVNSFILLWFCVELNMIAFIFIMLNNNSKYAVEQLLKYFFSQVPASMLFLMSILAPMKWSGNIMILSMMIKLSMIPFHKWLIDMVNSMNWFILFILVSIQKILPMVIISYSMNKNINLVNVISIISLGLGGGLGASQNSAKQMMSFSSISQSGWMLIAMTLSTSLWLMNFIFYSLILFSIILSMHKMNIKYIIILSNKACKMNFILICANIMSMAGMPPFVGFFMKFSVLTHLFNKSSMGIMTILISLGYYFSMMMYLQLFCKILINVKFNTMIKNKYLFLINMIILLLAPVIYLL